MSENSLKKVLVVSSYAPPSIGGPQNLYNLLRDFPSENYTVLTSYYNIDDISALKGSWLAGNYIFYDNPKATKETRQEAARTKNAGSSLSGLIQKLRFIMKRMWLARVLAGFPVIASQTLVIITAGKQTIKNKDIDIMLGFSDYGPAMLATFFLHKLTGKPYVIFLFDLYKGNFLPFPGGLFANLFEKLIFKNADKLIVTNEGTKEFYQKTYGTEISNKIFVIYNSVFPEAYEKTPANLSLRHGEGLEILFTGRIYWPQIGALQNLIKAVNEMEEKVSLKIYSPSPKEYLQSIGIQESSKILIKSATPGEIPDIQKNADVLFLPLSWNTKSQAIIDTATPGKLTDYLITGKPILIHAPTSTHLVEYAKEKNFALIVDKDDVEKLKKGIRKLITDQDYAKVIVRNAKATFFENHDASKNSQIFYNLFTTKQ